MWCRLSWQWSPWILVAAFLLSLMQSGIGYESGAPVESCRTLVPDHNQYPPQNSSVSPSPYVVEFSESKSQGQPGEVSIRLSGSYFTGFLLQVHDDHGSAMGQFVSSARGSQLMTCYRENDSITHTNGMVKKEMEFTWRPSSVPAGNIYLKGTIAKTMRTFWTNVTFELPQIPQDTENARDSILQSDITHELHDL